MTANFDSLLMVDEKKTDANVQKAYPKMEKTPKALKDGGKVMEKKDDVKSQL